MSKKRKVDIRQIEDELFGFNYRNRHRPKSKGNKRESHRKRKAVKISLHILSQFCHYCRRRMSFNEATLDHLIPLARGGGNDISNLTLACYKCNHDKADMTELEYFNLLKERNV